MKEKIIMWGAIIGLAILLFLIPTKGNALTKDEIKEYVKNQPFDFQQMTRDSEAYNELLFRERDRIFQFVEIDKYPTVQERRMYYILHAVDVGMTIWALNNRDNVKEGNILLSNNPSNRALITNKLITIPIYQNMNQAQIVTMNHIVGTVIVHNMYVIARYD